ncbi:MAG: peptidylprolyl isomerase [Kangiellaceae bacterium]|nr:peptidylprolyl isomerase [Kangiellaceae bacterium]
MKIKSITKSIALFLLMMMSSYSHSTIVLLSTNHGDIEINLYDQSTPQTVENFLNYVNNGDYDNVIIHRAVSNFVIQGGGFTYNGGTPLNNNNLPLEQIESDPSVDNEPVFSNIRGTIAMAKVGGLPNSATNEWFINLVDNNALTNRENLDRQNEGFTVFGEVINDGMVQVDTIAAVTKYNFGGAFTAIPLNGYDTSTVPANNNLVIISSITVIDAAADTAANLNPMVNVGPFVEPDEPSSSGGGGSIIWLLPLLYLLTLRRKTRN